MLLVHNANHLPSFYLQCRTVGDRSGSRQTKPTPGCERLLSNEVACGEQCDRGFLTVFRNDCDFCAPFLKIEDGVSRTSLREESPLWFQLDDSSPQSSVQ